MSDLSDTIRRAKARLSDFTINEVSLVDKAANLRSFVLIKSKDGNMGKTQKMTLKLPAAAQQALMDGLGQVIDKVTALASVVGDAEKDDTAAVPEELVTGLGQVAQMLTGMASQYGGAGSSAAGADNAPGNDGSQTEQAPATNPAPDMGKNLDGTAKALPAPHKDAPFKTELHEGDNLKTILRKAIAAASLEVASFEGLEKAGRKMAGARYKKLSELHDNLGKLLNELAYDESAEAKELTATSDEAEKAKKPPPPPPKKDDKETPPAAKAETSPEVAALAKQLVELQTELRTALAKGSEQETKIVKLGTELAAVSKVQGVSNAGPVDGPPSTEPKSSVAWPIDMSEHVAKKREAARKANGAR